MPISPLTPDPGYMGNSRRGASLGRTGHDWQATAAAAREDIASLESTLAQFADPSWIPGCHDRDKETGAVTFEPNFPTVESRALWVAGLEMRLTDARRELTAAESSPGDCQRFHLVRMPLDSGGYDSGGAYWGHGDPMWRYESADGQIGGFDRARDRAAAKLAVLEIYPRATFYR